eukprot:298337-Pyramimonas_sp.AAC.1
MPSVTPPTRGRHVDGVTLVRIAISRPPGPLGMGTIAPTAADARPRPCRPVIPRLCCPLLRLAPVGLVASLVAAACLFR